MTRKSTARRKTEPTRRELRASINEGTEQERVLVELHKEFPDLDRHEIIAHLQGLAPDDRQQLLRRMVKNIAGVR